MDATTTIDDLFSLHLVDGLAAESQGKAIRYRTVLLRETNVADERAAQRLAERVVMVQGTPRLLVSDADFRLALTMRHIDAFVCDGQRIPQGLIDLDLVGKLSSHDLGLIEQRIFLIGVAAQVRYGLVSEADFAALATTGAAPAAAGVQAPQRGGQAAGMGPAAAGPRPGPSLLADYARDAADRPAAGDGR